MLRFSPSFSSSLWMALFCTFFFSCTADQLPEPTSGNCEDLAVTYAVDIAPIIASSCNYSGCHLDSAPGNYSSYDGLQGVLASGAFFTRVITLKDDPNQGMPPDFVPAGRPENLTEEELNLVRCWAEAGFPEN